MNYVATEVLRVLRLMRDEIRKYKPVKPSSIGLKKGLEVTRTATLQEEWVHPTPIMKNAMIVYGDVKQVRGDDGEWHTGRYPANGKLGKAATNLIAMLGRALEHEFGPRKDEYDRNVPISDPSYYVVDCWNFFDQLEKKWWDIVPNMTKELLDRYRVYTNPKTNMSLDSIIKMIETDPELQRALEIENRIWPTTRASMEISKISDPFMSKKSGVSYPDYSNDSKTVPGTNMTYGAYEIKLAVDAFRKGGLRGAIEFALRNAIYSGYMRRQMSKARALIAASRRSNLIINMVNGVEMENVKETKAIQIPFLNEEDTLKELSKICELCEKNDIIPFNIDASAWDQNLGEGPLVLQDAERYVLAQGAFTRQLVMLRTLMNSKGYFINGQLATEPVLIHGRQFSGYLDTTLGNTKANRITATCSALKTSKSYVKDVIGPMKGYHIITVGDDLLVCLKTDEDVKTFIDHEVKDFGLVIHGDEKFARGVFFIQWRVFKLDGKYIMAYNVPRVFRSCCSKEDAKHLGRFGWTCAYYQQLGKLRMYPTALKIPVNILAAFDQYHLSLDLPVDRILEGVKQEDQLAISKAKGKPVESTAERMFRSNPNIAGLTQSPTGKVELDPNYFEQVQSVMKSVYDPQYLLKLGFSIPDLSNIH